jgi:phenylalanyl-tRNA synthetase beta chain
MKVPLSWLAEFVEVRVEPRRLAEDLTLAGLAVDAVESDGKDTVLDLDITTNRVDCMNVYGVAREVSVLYKTALRPLDVAFTEAGEPAAKALRVEVEAPELCPRFCARVLDVRIGPSPPWIRDRLEAVGVRPINNVVDLTNYVMMEMGHPSHAFDVANVPDARLVIRWARDGERVTTLDGVERVLAGRVGVVAGPDAPLALAGIMGGASSEVSDTTRTVALEAAYWDPLSIRRAAKGLGMHTEASHRFERGADPEGPVAATARIAHLVQKTGAGSARPGLIDQRPAPVARKILALRVPQLRRVLGALVPAAEARGILLGLGFVVSDPRGETMTAEVPTWRSDVSREADLVEEVGRHHGLSSIPGTLPPGAGVEGLRPAQAMERAVREVLVGAGLDEVVNYAFVADAAAGEEPRVRLANPLAEDQGALRNALVMPGLLSTLRSNLRRGTRDVRIFELGRVFLPSSGAPLEERRLGLLITGAATKHWSEERRRGADFFDAKGILEILARRVGRLDFEPGKRLPSHVHPGKAARVLWNGQELGYVGALHPDAVEAWEAREETVVAELSLEPVLAAPRAAPRFEPLSRFPEVARDVSVVCDDSLTAAELERTVRAAAGGLLRSSTVTDRYQGPPVPAGKVGLTLSLVYHDPSRTLTGEEVQSSVDAVLKGLRARGAEIRGE